MGLYNGLCNIHYLGQRSKIFCHNTVSNIIVIFIYKTDGHNTVSNIIVIFIYKIDCVVQPCALIMLGGLWFYWYIQFLKHMF